MGRRITEPMMSAATERSAQGIEATRARCTHRSRRTETEFARSAACGSSPDDRQCEEPDGVRKKKKKKKKNAVPPNNGRRAADVL